MPSLFCYFFLPSRNKIKTSFFWIIILALPVLLGLFRYNIGTDYASYDGIFSYLKDRDWSGILNIFGYPREIGFNSIVKILSSFNNPIIFGFFSFLTLFPILICLAGNYEKRVIAVAFLCYLWMYFPVSFNALRQCLSCSLLFCGLHSLINNKVKSYLILVILALSIHLSAIVGFLFIFLVDPKSGLLKKKFVNLFLLITLFFLVSWPFVFKILGVTIYANYANRQTLGYNFSFFIRLFILAILYCFKNKLIFLDKRNSIFIYFQTLATLIGFFGFFYPYIIRMSWYFEYFNIISIASLPKAVNGNLSKAFVLITIVGFCLFYFYGVQCGFCISKNSLMPYYFIDF